MTEVESAPRPEVQLSLGGPQPQRRLVTGFRLLLAIPHLLWAVILGFVGFFAVVVTWFAALVLGRVPTGLHEFLTGILRYFTRMMAYTQHLLTDEYPSFALHPEGEGPVEALVPPPGRLNRAAVLFRVILMIPAGIVVSLVGSGISTAGVLVWLIVLIKGRQPRSLHQALAACLRYQTRAYAYFGMLTSEYPRGLFGDQAPPAADVAPADAAELAAAPAPTGAAVIELPAEPRTTRLVLSSGAKRIIALFLVVGALTSIGTNAARAASTVQGNRAADRLQDEHAVLEEAIAAFGTKIQSCGLEGGAQCVHEADRAFAAALESFRDELRSVGYPQHALGLARAVQDDADALIDVLHERQATEDAATYQQLTARFQQVANRFDQDYRDLYLTLRQGGTIDVGS